MKKLFILVLMLLFIFIPLSNSIAAPAGRIELPLPSGDSDEVIKIISPKLMLIVCPDGDGWDVEVAKRKPAGPAYNLLYHSDEWHGPYETQVYAWHIAKEYFDNSRWLCVKGYPVEVHILIKEPKVVKSGEEFVFQSGTLIVEWFKRRCTRGIK